MKPNKENIRKWVEALRSGEFKQTTHRLCGDSAHCCLGVACEVAIRDGLEIHVELHKRIWEGREIEEKEYDGCPGELPPAVAKWLGFCTEDPYGEDLSIDTDPSFGSDEHNFYCATAWNDEYGSSFEEIADMLEATYLRDGQEAA